MTDEGGEGDGLRVSVLGSLMVSCRGEELALGMGMRRVVFGLLAVHPNIRLHRRSIIDILWPDGPPATAVNQVQAHVSRLRRILGPGPDDPECPLRSFGTSYMLHATSGQLDLLAFHDLGERAMQARARGDLPAACGLYEKALNLWRGEPLDELDLLRGIPAVSELERQRTDLIVEYSDAAFGAGLHDRVLPHLRALAAREPLNEKAHARLMIALAHTGQQAASLRIFDELRCRLDDELGVCPGTELADAHQCVLRQDFPRVTKDAASSAVLAPGAVPAVEPIGVGVSGRFPVHQLPPAVADFTGRAAEVAGLTGVLAPSPERIGVPVAVITGPPGVGKTALALQVAHLTRHMFPDGQLHVQLAGSTRLPRDPGDVLGELLRALGLCQSAIPDSAAERSALFRSRTAGQQILVMADDAGSANQVRPLIPGAASCAVLVTSRSPLAGLAEAHLCCLDPLPHPDAVEMLARIAGTRRVAAEAEASARLVSACGCLPLVVRIAGAGLAARPSRPVAAVADAVAGWPVAALLGEPSARDVINILVGKSLLTPAGTDASGEPRYRLHDLLRDFAIEQLSAEHETEFDFAAASLCEPPRVPLRTQRKLSRGSVIAQPILSAPYEDSSWMLSGLTSQEGNLTSMKIRMSLVVPAFAAAVAAAGLTVTPALASTSAPATASRPAITAAQGTARPTAAQPATNCPWTASNGQKLGTIICEYGISLVPFPNGTEEAFAVGTSHAVWTAWDNTSGNWSEESMGGLAYSAVTVKAHNGWSVEITVQSSSGGTYCNYRGGSQDSGWSGWSSGDC